MLDSAYCCYSRLLGHFLVNMSSVSGPPPSDIFYKWRIAAGICIPLSALLFAARMASRWLQNHSFDASDATLFAALLTSFGADALTLASMLARYESNGTECSLSL